MNEGKASFTLTFYLYVCLHISDGVRRQTAPQFGGKDRSGPADAQRVQTAGSRSGGFDGKRSEPSIWRAANPPVYYLKWKSGVHRRYGAHFLQNTRGQEVAN